MIDLRMVADDRGNLQLQYRRRDISVDAAGRLCDGGDWLEWKSVPIVYDPSQLVDKAKPDGGLTREQVAKILKTLKDEHDRRLKKASGPCLYGVSSDDRALQADMAFAYSDCIAVIRSELNRQPDEPSVEQDQDSESRLDGVCKLHPINNLEVVEASGKYYFLDGHEIQAWVLSQKVTFIADRSHAFDLIASVDQDEPDQPF